MLLDNREHGLRELLPSAPFKQLPVADIWIGLSGEEIVKGGLMIERKTVADLEASILDNRYREQRSRLLSVAAESGAHACYIIEGEIDRLGPVRLNKQALQKFITRLMIRYHIPVFQTDSLRGTADLVSLMEEQWKSDPTTFEQPQTLSYIETRGKTRQENTDDPAVFACSVLMCCRGVSAAGAKGILEGCGGKLSDVLAAPADRLAAIQIGKKKLGKAVAERLYTLLHN
jgi:ERCC4-type nuclease